MGERAVAIKIKELETGQMEEPARDRRGSEHGPCFIHYQAEEDLVNYSAEPQYRDTEL